MRSLSKRMGMAALAGAVSVMATALSRAQYDGDFRIWNEFMVREYQGEKWQTYTWAELRWVDDASRLGTWLAQQKVYYQATPTWQLGGGPAWIEVQGADGSWNTLARLELEANPSWKLSDEAKLTLRNRLETRWWESRDWRTEFVTRHRLSYSKGASWFGSMSRYEVSNELFFDYAEGRFNENRFRPINLFFKVGDKASVNWFAQVRSRRLAGDRSWSHAYIMGTGLRW